MASYCIASVQHTGTWFTINMASTLQYFKTPTDMVFHHPEKPDNILDHVASWNDELYHIHLGHQIEFDMLDKILTKYKVIIPVRDPLIALLTREHYHPELTPHAFILDGFQYLANLHQQNPQNVFFLPIDLYRTEEDRRELISRLAEFLDIKDPTHQCKIVDRIINSCATQWDDRSQVELLDEPFLLRDMYESGQCARILNMMYTKGSTLFDGRMIQIREFLKNIGYDALLWYDLIETNFMRTEVKNDLRYCIASVQHTGTWFVINTIRMLTSESSYNEFILPPNPHTDEKAVNYIKNWENNGGGCVLHFHWLENNVHSLFKNRIDLGDKVIIPVRDPMLSLISRENRHPEESPYNYIIDGFVEMNKIYKKQYSNVFFFPIGLYKDRSDRETLLMNLIEFLDVDYNKFIVDNILDTWDHPVNINEDVSELKHIYKDGYTQHVLDYFARNGSNFNHHAYVLRSFLMSLGYQDLPWFDKIQQVIG